MIKEGETVRACVHSVDVLVSVVKRHAIANVQCVLVIRVVIGVHIPLEKLYFSTSGLDSPCCTIHPTLLR